MRRPSGKDQDRGRVGREADQAEARRRGASPDQQALKAMRPICQDRDGCYEDRTLDQQHGVQAYGVIEGGCEAVALEADAEPRHTDHKRRGVGELCQDQREENESCGEQGNEPNAGCGPSVRVGTGPSGPYGRASVGAILRATDATPEAPQPMQYLPLFLLFAAALIAGWFYLQRAKTRDVSDVSAAPEAPAVDATTTPADRSE